MSFATAQKTDSTSIPIIDITALRDGSDPITVAKALHHASQNLGFIYIKGHGISEDDIKSARKAAYEFFHKSDTEKAHVKVSDKHRGWLGYGSSKMDDDIAPDLKESFIWGHEDHKGHSTDDHPIRGVNKWPQDQPDLRQAAMVYFEQAQKVAHHLMQAFAIGLELDPSYFLQTSDKPLSRASFVYYPPQDIDQNKEQFGVGPHTDFGVLTVLCQDDVGGLQVENLKGDWIEAPPVDGALIVNVGDLLSRWTEGSYRSTPHRVVNTSGKERLSLVLAYDPNPETMIDAKGIFGPDHTPKEEAISCGDYLIWRFKKAFSYRK